MEQFLRSLWFWVLDNIVAVIAVLISGLSVLVTWLGNRRSKRSEEITEKRNLVKEHVDLVESAMRTNLALNENRNALQFLYLIDRPAHAFRWDERLEELLEENRKISKQIKEFQAKLRDEEPSSEMMNELTEPIRVALVETEALSKDVGEIQKHFETVKNW